MVLGACLTAASGWRLQVAIPKAQAWAEMQAGWLAIHKELIKLLTYSYYRTYISGYTRKSVLGVEEKG